MHTIERRIKYEAELDSSFADEIASAPGCETILACIQCGTCSATCPLSIYMDYTPRRVVAMTRAGFKQEVLNCFTIWLCASCYSCTVECPKQIKITDVMYALKQRAIKDRVYRNRRFPIPVLAREFFKSVAKRGRNSESRLVVRMYLKSDIFQFVKQSILGMRLWSRGRMKLRSESIKNRKQLRALLRSVDQRNKAKAQKTETGSGVRV